jgi:hypothetical protein
MGGKSATLYGRPYMAWQRITQHMINARKGFAGQLAGRPYPAITLHMQPKRGIPF